MFLKINRLASACMFFTALFLFSCAGSQSDKKGEKDKDAKQTLFEQGFEKQAENVKTIFYNIPSPLEMSELMKRANLAYNPEMLNSLENLDQYTSTKSMALNLGVYGADLSYTRLYDQVQESINYLAAIRTLSENLGVPQQEGMFSMDRLEENINNRDSLIYIITDVYANADVYLKENERSSTAALIIAGGWIEALHIATHLLDAENPNPEIMERIAEQKYSLKHLLQLLENEFPEKESIEEVFAGLNELKEAYAKVETVYKPGQVVTDEENKLTSINSKTEIYINFDQINKIREINKKLRERIIS